LEVVLSTVVEYRAVKGEPAAVAQDELLRRRNGKRYESKRNVV
jgi:hypothetical protein